MTDELNEAESSFMSDQGRVTEKYLVVLSIEAVFTFYF